MSTYSPRQWASALALIFGAGFVICFFWGAVIADPALKELHLALLRMYIPGFTGFTGGSFANGLVQSVVWGLVIGWALASSLNLFAKNRGGTVKAAAAAANPGPFPQKKRGGGGCCH